MNRIARFIAMSLLLMLGACAKEGDRVATADVAATAPAAAPAVPAASVPVRMPQAATHQAGDAAEPVTATPQRADTGSSPAKPQRIATDRALPPVVVYKSPYCGCCELWVEHMRAAGFTVEVRDVEDLGPIKTEAGIPAGKGSCHTARVGDYYVEGHVPAGDVKRLLADKPKGARGLIVPGMPQGSPGMEQGRPPDPYDVLLLDKDGATTVFAHYEG